MRITIIGGSGHVGTYLVPRLVELGHEVTCVTRGTRAPYLADPTWESVRRVSLDREALEKDGTFARRILELRGEVVIDLICFTLDSARHLVQALEGRVQHYLCCGTIWVHGHSVQVPTTEEQPRQPFGEYGLQKAAIESYLLERARLGRFPVTVLHPGHIVGQGWVPLNPAANFNPRVFAALARGEELALPNLGLETVHHVHAQDVTQAFLRALSSWSTAVGESFHVVSPAALTLRGYAEAVASWFGREARLRYLPWDQWREGESEEDVLATWDHIAHSPNCSIDKARRLLGFEPRYGSLQAVRESLGWLIAQGVLHIKL